MTNTFLKVTFSTKSVEVAANIESKVTGPKGHDKSMVLLTRTDPDQTEGTSAWGQPGDRLIKVTFVRSAKPVN